MSEVLTFALIICSDRAARGEREDRTAEGVRSLVEKSGHRLAETRVVADEIDGIREQLSKLAVSHDVVLTTGGTGIGPRDCTVEATESLLDRTLPGMAEAMRQRSLVVTPMAMLSRATAGTRGRSLIINLPGSPRGAVECLEVVLPTLVHASKLLRSAVTDCQEDLK